MSRSFNLQRKYRPPVKIKLFGGIGTTKVIIRLTEKDIFVFCVYGDGVSLVIFYLNNCISRV
jgi:hypothetical protein